MLDFLKVIRYLVFFVFIVSNTVVTSVAVWNLTIVQGSVRFSSTAAATASYLIAIAGFGLLLVFPIVFLEITGRRTFLGVVWFELIWTGLMGLMTLIGASLITSLSSRELCFSPTVTNRVVSRPILVSPCSSAQVLGVFTWMPATFLLAYVTLLSILIFVQSKDDPSIWKFPVRDLPMDKILGGVRRNSINVRNSIIASLPQIRRSPVIHAPRPRHVIPPLLDCRSSRNSAYDFKPPPLPPKSIPVRENSRYQPSVRPTAFYNSAVQKVIESGNGPRMPSLPRPVQPGQGKREQASPPPLGDWPRLDATSRPRTKRYHSNPQAQELLIRESTTGRRDSSRRAAPSSTMPVPFVERHRTSESSTMHRDSSRRRATPLVTPVPFVERPSVSPRPSRPRTTNPPGSGRQGSMDSRSSSQHRPPPLDLSRISTHLSRSERSRARAGR